MPKLKHRMVFDLLLTAMLVFEMFYQFTGNALHEYVGFAFFACIVAHLLFSRRWIACTASSVGKKKMNSRRKGLAVMALLLLIDVVALGVSSVIISNTLWNLGVNLTALNPSGVWIVVHNATAYGLCALTLAHLAMHWIQVANVFKVEYDPSRRRAIAQCMGVAVGLGAVALGVVGARQVGESAADFAARAFGEEAYAETGTVTGTGTTAAFASVEDVSAPSDSTSASSMEKGSKSANRGDSIKGNHHGRSEESASSADTGASTQSSQEEDAGVSPSQGYTYQEEEETSSSVEGSGICPLCPKQCPLSAPRCNRPYEEGIL